MAALVQLSCGRLLGYQGDGGGAGLDGQAGLDGVLGDSQVAQGMPVGDGQVRNDVGELALEWGERRVTLEDTLGQVPEGAGVARGEPEHVVAEPVCVIQAEADEYLRVLAEMADASGGGIADPPQTVGDCRDWEDNRILDLAAEVGAFLIMSADADLTSMSPWRGRPVIEPAQFASMIDASRRARRRLR